MSLSTASTTLDLLQTVLSTYATYLSYTAAVNIRTWEGPTKTAARHSEKANDQLLKSRTTLASGLISTSFSLLSAAAPLVLPVKETTKLILTIVNILALVGARRHIAGFWGTGAKVPGATRYNEGARTTVELRVWMGYAVAVAALQGAVRAWATVRG